MKEKQEMLKYKVEKITFIVKPIHKKSGETLREILIKLMRVETKKS